MRFMLQKMRDKTTGWLTKIIMIVIILTFALWGVQRLFVSGSGTATVVKVGHAKITSQTYGNAYSLARRQAQMQLGPKFFDNPNLPQQIKDSTLQHLVNQAAIQNKLNSLGFIVGPNLLEANLIGIPGFQVNGQFSAQRFQQTVMSMGYTTQQFMAQLSQQIMTTQLQAGLIGSDFFSPAEAAKAQAAIDQQREFNYLTIPASQFTKKVQLSGQAINAYYQQHQAAFKTPEQVSVSYIQLSLAELAKSIKPDNAALQQFYQENTSRFHNKSYDTVAAQVKQAYVQQAAQKLLASKTSDLTNLSYEHPNALQPLASSLKLPIQTTSLFSRQGTKAGLTAQHDFVAAAFSPNVLQQHNNSGVITLSDNAVAILHLDKHAPMRLKPLAEVKGEITVLLTQQQAKVDAQKLGQQLVSAIKSGGSTAGQLVDTNGLKWQHSGFVGRQDKKITASVLSLAFLLPANKQAAAGLSLLNGDFAVVSLQAWKPGKSTLTAKQQETYQQVMAHAYGNTAYQLYQKQVLDTANIRYYKKNMPVLS
jgi:peptidyl-prolyl cis-trans isomerase D